jgi:hypothetical protein
MCVCKYVFIYICTCIYIYPCTYINVYNTFTHTHTTSPSPLYIEEDKAIQRVRAQIKLSVSQNTISQSGNKSQIPDVTPAEWGWPRKGFYYSIENVKVKEEWGSAVEKPVTFTNEEPQVSNIFQNRRISEPTPIFIC